MVREPRYPPLITGFIIGICAFVFGSVLKQGQLTNDVLASYWVYNYPFQVWEGRYWTLLTSAFVHVQPLHMLFNLVLLWALAGRLEQIYGHQATFAVFFFGAILTDGAQFALTGATGIGLSGVVFALFGWLWATHKQVPDLRKFMTPAITRLFAAWLVLVALMSWMGLWPTGNGAHLAGLVFGLAVGYVFYHRHPAFKHAGIGALAALAGVVVLGLTCAPWSNYWSSWRYMQAQKTGDATGVEQVERELAQSRDPETLNTAAWIMATSSDSDLRNGQRAVELARRACELTHWNEPACIDTLAAAYAETDDWTEATKAQQRIQGLVGGNPALKLPEYALNMDRIARKEKIRE